MTDSTSSFSKFFFDFNRVTKAKRINIKKDEKGPQGVLKIVDSVDFSQS